MNEIQAKRGEVEALVQHFADAASNKKAGDFISGNAELVALSIALNAFEAGDKTTASLLQVVAFGVYLAETGKTHLLSPVVVMQ